MQVPLLPLIRGNPTFREGEAVRRVTHRHIAIRLGPCEGGGEELSLWRDEAEMAAAPEIETLRLLVARYVKRTDLTPDERREILHIARGLSPRESAQIERVMIETIRTRRKNIYRKLKIPGGSELISALLALSLETLIVRRGAS
jgi:DNA-binding CsgD family transcriptional regulator